MKKLWPGQNSCFRLLCVFQFDSVFKIEIWEPTLGGWNHRHDEMHFHFQVKILVFFKILWGISPLHLFFLKSRNLSFIRDGRLFIKAAAWEKFSYNYCASSQPLYNLYQVCCCNSLLESCRVGKSGKRDLVWVEVDIRKVRPLQTLSHYFSQQFGIHLERLLIWIMFRGYQLELIGE